jgi:hypothetical protein
MERKRNPGSAMREEQLLERPLWFTVDPRVAPKWLKGYEPTSAFDFGAIWAGNWYAE